MNSSIQIKALVTSLLLFAVLTKSQQFKLLETADSFTIDSKILNQKQDVWVYFPEDFESKRDSCSVLLLLDGDEYFGMATDVYKLYQSAGKMPPTVIVALPSTTKSRWKYYTPSLSKNISGRKENDSLFASSGHFKEYADFIENEVLAGLQSKYKLKFVSKTIFGHSMGGLAVMSFYRYKPELFNNYIAASPSLLWEQFVFNRYYEEQFPMSTKTHKKLFLSAGSPDSYGYKEAAEDLYDNLKLKLLNPENVVRYQHYQTEDHMTTGLRSLLDGLEFVYQK